VAAIPSAVPSVRFLVLIEREDSSAIPVAIAAGVAGYLLKEVDPAELAPAVRSVWRELFIGQNILYQPEYDQNHIRNILDKLQLRSRTEAVVYAVREKLVDVT
jgi:DNA-binding NarL/FixJ family response regulator